MTKRVLLTGRTNRHGSTLDYVKPRQETLHKCPGCEREFGRSEMRIVDDVSKCITCASPAQDEGKEE